MLNPKEESVFKCTIKSIVAVIHLSQYEMVANNYYYHNKKISWSLIIPV